MKTSEKTFDEFEELVLELDMARIIFAEEEEEEEARIVVSIKDVTKRREAEEALREKSHLNQTLLDAFPCVALLLRPQTREIISSNAAAVKVGAVPGTHCFSTWGQRHDPCPWCLAPALWATGEAQHLEVEARGIFWDAHWIPVTEDLYMHFAFDITDRKQVEEKLRESDELLNATQRLTKVGGWEWNVEKQAMYWTEETYVIHDFVPGEMVPGSTEHIAKSTECYDTEDRPVILAAFQRCVEEGQPYDFDFPFTTAKGRRLWIRTTAHPVLESGKVIRVIGNIMDITERKQVEEDLRRSEENFRRSLDDSLLGVRIVTEDGETIYANRTILDIYGYDSIEDLNTTPVKMRYTPESYAEFQIRKEKRWQGVDAPSEYEVSIIRKNGDVRQLQVFRKEVLWDGERQFQAVYQDITESKRAESEIQALAKFPSENPNPILRIARDGTLLYVNAAGLSQLPDWHLNVGQSVPSMIRDVASEALNSGKTRLLDLEHSGRVYSFFVAPIADAGYINLYGRDITERKRAEEELRASREQMRALAGRLQAVREEERTDIAREIHDELGGALTGMKVDVSFLIKSALKIENEAARTSLLAGMDSVAKAIDTTIHTVRRIAMELRPGILDDLGLVAALEWQLKDFEKRTGIRCEFLPPEEDIDLDADLSTALFRIFQEALTNVVRHSGATEVHVCLRADADSSVLEVEDNGKGIEKEKTLSSKSLGLLGMRERAQMFGGRITVTGTPGTGTTVTVEISPVEKRKMDRDQKGDAG